MYYEHPLSSFNKCVCLNFRSSLFVYLFVKRKVRPRSTHLVLMSYLNNLNSVLYEICVCAHTFDLFVDMSLLV